MSLRLPKVVLQDMVEASEKVLEFTADYNLEDFLKDVRTRDAVYHNLIILGEASSRMPEIFVLDHDEIPWQKMISTRNALVHGYGVIDDRIVWKIVKDILPKLNSLLQNLLASL